MLVSLGRRTTKVIADGLFNDVTTAGQMEAAGGEACFSGPHA